MIPVGVYRGVAFAFDRRAMYTVRSRLELARRSGPRPHAVTLSFRDGERIRHLGSRRRRSLRSITCGRGGRWQCRQHKSSREQHGTKSGFWDSPTPSLRWVASGCLGVVGMLVAHCALLSSHGPGRDGSPRAFLLSELTGRSVGHVTQAETRSASLINAAVCEPSVRVMRRQPRHVASYDEALTLLARNQGSCDLSGRQVAVRPW